MILLPRWVGTARMSRHPSGSWSQSLSVPGSCSVLSRPAVSPCRIASAPGALSVVNFWTKRLQKCRELTVRQGQLVVSLWLRLCFVPVPSCTAECCSEQSSSGTPWPPEGCDQQLCESCVVLQMPQHL